MLERRHLDRVRDEVDRHERVHRRILDLVDRKRDAVDRDRALVGEIRREDAGGADDEAPRFGDLLHAFNLTHAVDVTAHEMAVDAVAEMSAITEKDVKNMIEMKINNVFDYIDGSNAEYSEVQYDFSKLEKSVSDYFADFAEKNNVATDEEYNQQLQKTIETAESEINNFTDVYMLKMIEKTGAFSKLNKLYGFVNPLIYITAGLTALCIIIILFLSRNNFFYWLSSAFLCSSVLALIPCLYFKFSGYLDKLVIRNDYIYSAVTGMLNGTLNKYIALQAGIFAVGIVLMVIYILISKKISSKDKNNN